MKNKSGQSLVEVVFAIGLIMLVVTGIISLLINIIGTRTKSYDRNRAVELSQLVMEGIVGEKSADPISFWNLGSAYWTNLATNRTDVAFSDYLYSATPAAYSGNGCSNTVTECIDVTVNITWKNGNVNNQFNRFFSRK